MSSGQETLHADWLDTPLGRMAVVADQTHLHLLEYRVPSALAELAAVIGRPVAAGRTPAIDRIESELIEYFAGRSGQFQTPLALDGSPFERKVWQALLAIPLGETRSYGDIAREVDTIDSVRAVARANGSNRIAILVPCHRCIGSDGSLTGYGGGLWRKQWLLRHEGKMRPVGLFAREQSWNRN